VQAIAPQPRKVIQRWRSEVNDGHLVQELPKNS